MSGLRFRDPAARADRQLRRRARPSPSGRPTLGLAFVGRGARSSSRAASGAPWPWSSTTDEPLPPDTEGRLAEFTELVATAIANAESRAELDASRARIVATADATRRRIERDLHDGAQQQLVSLALELRAAQEAVPAGARRAPRRVVRRRSRGSTSVLGRSARDRARDPPARSWPREGSSPALKTLARRSPIPVKLDVRAERPAAGAGRGGGLLRRLGGAHERGQVRSCVGRARRGGGARPHPSGRRPRRRSRRRPTLPSVPDSLG